MIDALREQRLSSLQRGSLKLAGVGAVLCALLALFNLESFLRAYLLGFLFWWVIAVGCLGLVMLHELTGGRWGEGVRPFLNAGAATLPLLAALFLVVAIGSRQIYPWAHADPLAAHPWFQQWYFDPPFFLARAAGYFLIWFGFLCALCEPPYLPAVGVRRWRSLASGILAQRPCFASIARTGIGTLQISMRPA